MELNEKQLENVLGGVSMGDGGAEAVCKTCGSKLKYLGQGRDEGGNTGEYICVNTNYNNTGKNCPAFHIVKFNTEVDFV